MDQHRTVQNRRPCTQRKRKIRKILIVRQIIQSYRIVALEHWNVPYLVIVLECCRCSVETSIVGKGPFLNDNCDASVEPPELRAQCSTICSSKRRDKSDFATPAAG